MFERPSGWPTSAGVQCLLPNPRMQLSGAARPELGAARSLVADSGP